MQISQRKLNETLARQIFAIFNQVLADTKDANEIGTILSDLLTETERVVLAKRLAIATFLEKGRSYENIKQSLKVSSATIASVAEMMGNPGFQLALQKVKAEEWADEWAERIGRMFKGILGKKK